MCDQKKPAQQSLGRHEIVLEIAGIALQLLKVLIQSFTLCVIMLCKRLVEYFHLNVCEAFDTWTHLQQ